MNFNYIGSVDISNIKLKLLNMNESVWLENTIRQTTFDVHRHTETIYLMWDMESLATNVKGTIHPNFYNFGVDKLLTILSPLYEKTYGNGEFIRVVLAKLKKNTKIYPHIDSGESLSSCKRTHIPVISNPLVKFTIDDETKFLQEGEIWEINNQNTHSVENMSEIDRIHFIIDYMVSDKIKKIKLLI